jgi:hypothetical protein
MFAIQQSAHLGEYPALGCAAAMHLYGFAGNPGINSASLRDGYFLTYGFRT